MSQVPSNRPDTQRTQLPKLDLGRTKSSKKTKEQSPAPKLNLPVVPSATHKPLVRSIEAVRGCKPNSIVSASKIEEQKSQKLLPSSNSFDSSDSEVVGSSSDFSDDENVTIIPGHENKHLPQVIQDTIRKLNLGKQKIKYPE